MVLALISVLLGFVLLVWSADRFVEGAAFTARYFGVPTLLIGMVVVGFGTSAPELLVSTLASIQGNPGLALGNAYGSNISNIALIIGITVLISPIAVHSQVLRKELPILILITALSVWQIRDGSVSRAEGLLLLAVFFVVMFWNIRQGMLNRTDVFVNEIEQDFSRQDISLSKAIVSLIVGLVILVASSRLLVWGAVEIASGLGVSDLIIGLTIVAVGTSLPELASSIAAAKKNEPDIALGNVIGSNIFNTLAVVGIAGTIQPILSGKEVFYRDALVMSILTLTLCALSYSFSGRPARINRIEGAVLFLVYIGYIVYLIKTAL
ncbi:MAG: calcium/sodium antiporter [Spirochaetota bacterium]